MGIVSDIKAGRELEGVTEEVLWAEAHEEFQGNARRVGIWARAVANSHGDHSKAEGEYLKFRVRELRTEVNKALAKRREQERSTESDHKTSETQSATLNNGRVRTNLRGVLMGFLLSIAVTIGLTLLHILIASGISKIYGISNPFKGEQLPIMSINWIVAQALSWCGAFAGGFFATRHAPTNRWMAPIILSVFYVALGTYWVMIDWAVGIEWASAVVGALSVYMGAIVYKEKFERTP